ncbi:MAG: metal-dependent hydrolase [Actinomycetota bacterium]|nr:metal-dependent hydrolase [Actinomycetota bacterium]
MLLWHLGIAALITYVSLGRRRIDYRYILAGAIAPDLVDTVLRLMVTDNSSGRYLAHTLVAVIAVAIALLLLTSGERRVAVFGLAVGWLLHLVGDGMWNSPRTFLWPAFGTAFSTTPAEPYSWDLVTGPFSHLGTWAAEAVGAACLAWFYVAFRLGEEGRLRRFLGDGYLRP